MTDFLSFNVLKELIKGLSSVNQARKDEQSRLVDDFGDFRRFVPSYVEPNLQHHNPADWHDEYPSVAQVTMPLFSFMNNFMKGSLHATDGRHQLFILGDAGMGKSSLLLMLKLFNMNSFWPKGYRCELFKISSDTEKRIANVSNKDETVLLLDALDEDRCSVGHLEERLIGLLSTSTKFRRVVITCRTQYFPKGTKDPFDHVGRMRVGPFLCPMVFISPFNDGQVDSYLNKKFSRRPKKRDLARSVVARMSSLRFRPLLLTYIEDILDSPVPDSEWQSYSIYKALVTSWLMRESRKLHEQGLLVRTDALLNACINLAFTIQRYGQRVVPREVLETHLSRTDLQHIEQLDIKGRTLLNLTSDDGYRFAHYSFQEFLIVLGIELGQLVATSPSFQVTDVMLEMLQQIGPAGRDLRSLNFANTYLSKLNFRMSDFRGSDLRNVNFCHAELQKCDFSGACLAGANLDHADLTDANLANANLHGASMQYTILTRANLEGAKVSSNTAVENCRFNETHGKWCIVGGSSGASNDG